MTRVKWLFSALAALILCVGSAGADTKSETGPREGLSNRVAVYYFHGNFRCVNCRNLEKYTKEAAEKYFGKELREGKVTFGIFNVETKGNEHFNDDYQLYTKSVILSLVKDGKEVKYDNLAKVWEYLRDREAFHQYIKNEVEKYLKEL